MECNIIKREHKYSEITGWNFIGCKVKIFEIRTITSNIVIKSRTINGVDLGEMDNMLLEKVEELRLFM